MPPLFFVGIAPLWVNLHFF